ncbi:MULTISPECIES: branched-chain amino acid ABC transporter permease [Bordetella]|uniref:Branched-chain amino acid ABC transporter permease n=1 Tax=Bordetella genomosp. 6 TaxID=463024 RepID=A0ABX4F9Q5_9BORD|nr:MULTISPECIES: branched-chain amino acid ABC transporter permease [Bordetella]AOB25110.1 branched-chain amino acid ABC transporter permease [Bordetella bronchiseptica]ARP78657.1 branched-chain amino acid ABC transporter permease [Bordetella genomosp. 6]AZW42351.1 branched-chain amino acid ABC transporter permease [Bordetella bronchiseptica]KCV62044.1 branched-chain amino acid ABC transporter, permease protein [Bordetella bronchiseptica 99-R-0433]OZI70196.1 branched-chain amino acid ABC trans
MSSSLAASAHASHRLQDQQAQRTRTRIATGIFAVLALGLAVVPMATSNISFAFYLMLWVTMASAMNICVGFTGYLPFGFVVFYGVGSYATGICYKVLGWPILPSLAAASAVGLLIALLFAPTLRLRGVYFGIVSLALATIMRLLISNLPDGFTGGSMGLILSSANNPTHSYYAMLAVMAATLATVTWLSISRLGKALKAIRDDDAAAACVGIHVPRTRLKAWLLAALFPALAGGIEAWYTNVVDPEYAFHVLITAKSIIYAMAGGFGTIIGPVVGTLALLGIDHLIWQKFPVLNLLLLGLVIVLLMLFLPRGIVGSLLKRYPQLRQYIA